MNRLSSQPKTQPQGRMTPIEYMIHKNIPIPNKAKIINSDTPALQHQSTIVLLPTSTQNSSDQLKKLLDEKTKEIEFLKQTENQSRLFTNQFQEMNENHQQETKQLLEQISNYKQRTNDLKSQLEQYIQELNKNTIKYQECCKEKDEYFKGYREYQQEYDLLRIQLQNKDNEILTLKDKIIQIEQQHHQDIKSQTQNSEQWKRSILDTQIREMTQQFNQDKVQFEIKIHSLENQNIELENKCVLLVQEIERIRVNDQNKNNNKMNQLTSENEQLRNQLQQMMLFIQEYEQQNTQQDQQQEEIMQQRMRIVILNSEIERLWLLITDHENKKQILLDNITQQNNIQIQQLKQQYTIQIQQQEEDIWNLQQEQNNWNKIEQELQNKCTMLTIELERLNLLIRENESNNQIILSQMNQLKINCQQYEQQITQLEVENSNYQQESILLNSENRHLQQKTQQLSDEIQTIQMNTQSMATRRSFELKQQIDQYTSELNRTQSNFNNLSQEYDNLQQEYQNVLRQIDIQQLQLNEQQDNLQNLQEQMQLMESKHKIETDELRKQGEFQRRSLLDSQIRELTQKFNNDKQLLENQIRQISQQKLQLESRCCYLQQELDKIPFAIEEQVDIQKQRLQISEKERINLLQEIKDYQSQLQYIVNDQQTQNENIIKERMKIIIYATEIERLWHVIEDLTNNYKGLEEQSQLENNKIQQLTNTIQMYQNKINNFEQDYQQLESDKQNLELSYQSLENKLILITSELERVKNQLYEEQSKEYEYEIKHKQLISEMEELYTQIETYQTEITEMQKNGLELSDLETKFQAQQISWETQKYQLNNQIKDYEQKILVQNQELRRISMVADDRLHELEALRSNFKDLQLNEKYEQLQQSYEQLEQQIMDLEQINLKLKSSNHTLESQNRLLEQTLQDKTKEIEETYNLMNRQRKQSEFSNREADVNRKNQQQFQQQINILEQQNQTLKEQLFSNNNEYQQLVQQVEYLQRNLSERDMMIQKKTNELNEKIKEMDALKIKYEQRLNTQTSTIRTSSITRQIVRTEQENILNESILKSKQQSIIVRPPRQVMSQLENQQE